MSKKPRGYRIFSKISFDSSGVVIFVTTLCSIHLQEARRKKIKKSFRNLIKSCNFL
jgi:hypothetical protein